MSEPFSRRRGPLPALLALLVIAAVAAAKPALAAPVSTEEGTALLAATDPGAAAPAAFRARMTVRPLGRDETIPLELWRAGDDALVRFLAPKDRGKALLVRGDDAWFLAPGVRQPVRLGPSHRLAGLVSLDAILGLRYAELYTVTGAERAGDGPLVTLELAGGDGAPYPRVRWVVDAARNVPVRAEHLLPSGKLASMIEFAEWRDAARLRPARLVVKDLLRKTPPVEVAIEEMEPRDPPEGLFDLDDPTARAALE